MRARRALWLLLCLVVGGPCAFLALETAGIPYAGLALVAVIWVGRRNRILPESMLAFGLTYAIEIFRHAIAALFSALEQNDYLTAAFFAVHSCIALAIIGAAALSWTSRRRMLQQG